MVFEQPHRRHFYSWARATWRIDEITHDRVLVSPLRRAMPGKMPFWHGDHGGTSDWSLAGGLAPWCARFERLPHNAAITPADAGA